MATLMGVSLRQLERYIEQGMPREGKGCEARYGPAAYKWFLDFQSRKNEAGRIAGAMKDELARKTKIDADRAELKLLHARGELVKIQSVRRELESVFTIMRSKLLNLPTKLAPVLFGMESKKKMNARISAEIREILLELVPLGYRP